MVSDHNSFANLIGQIADLLRGPYRPPQYERVMLPITLTEDQFQNATFDYFLINPPFGVDWRKQQSEMYLPLPPQEQQRAIVEHIARETAKLDAVRAATECTIALLKERRVALIAAAVTGQLDVRAAV